MKIGYCTREDPRDKRSWSGTHYYIMKALNEFSGEVIPLGPVNTRFIYYGILLNKATNYLFKRNFPHVRTTIVAKRLSKKLKKKISEQELDILFFSAGSELLAYLDTDLPVVILSDSTFNLVEGYFTRLSNIFDLSRRMANKIEQNSINKATKIIYSSQWAANSAIDYYGCNKDKITVIPFGANFDFVPTSEQISENLAQINNGTIKLLFVGVNWIKKGGEIAYKIMLELNNRNIDAELNIVGCTPPEEFRHEKMNLHGFLSKNDEKDSQKLISLFLEASFLIFPTRMECAGIVSCEASAFGLPVLSVDTGGVSTYVENDVNGYLFSLDSSIDEYVDKIIDVWGDKNKYQKLCSSSRKKYERELNWERWGKKASQIMKNLVTD